MSRLEHGKLQIDKFIKNKKRQFTFIQTKTSYERYHLIQYINSHKLTFEVVINYDEYLKYTFKGDTSHKLLEGKRFGSELQYCNYYYTKPIKYIKLGRRCKS